jgi:hypothetical protein
MFLSGSVIPFAIFVRFGSLIAVKMILSDIDQST